jgi:hypothetical protein
VDGRASSPRKPDGPGGAGGTTLSARKRTCRARRAASPRGVQAAGANESAPRVGQVLEELDEKLYRGEELRVGVEIVRVGSAIDHGIRAPLVMVVTAIAPGDGFAVAETGWDGIPVRPEQGKSRPRRRIDRGNYITVGQTECWS